MSADDSVRAELDAQIDAAMPPCQHQRVTEGAWRAFCVDCGATRLLSSTTWEGAKWCVR